MLGVITSYALKAAESLTELSVQLEIESLPQAVMWSCPWLQREFQVGSPRQRQRPEVLQVLKGQAPDWPVTAGVTFADILPFLGSGLPAARMRGTDHTEGLTALPVLTFFGQLLEA